MATVFSQMGTPRGSFDQYAQAADQRRANALAFDMGSIQKQNALQAMQDDAALREAGRNFGSDTAANTNALYQAGLVKQAQAYQKSVLDAQETKAGIGLKNSQAIKAEADAGKAKFDIAQAKIGTGMKILQSGTSPQSVLQLLQQSVQSGLMTPEEAQQSISDMPQDPAQFAQWRDGQLMQGMELSKRIELENKKRELAGKQANDLMIPDPANPGKYIVNEPLVGAKSRVAQSGASSITMGSPVPVQLPDGSTGLVQPANRPGAAPQLLQLPGTNKPLAPAKDPNAGPKIGAEVERQIGGVMSFDKDLAALEAALKDFNPRSTDQFNTTKRAQIQSLAKQAQLSAKEAAALGALSGPDMTLLEGILNDPTSVKGAVSGSAGLAAQIQEARAGNARRVASLKERYGDKATTGINVSGAKPAPTSPAKINSDAEYNVLPSGAMFVGPDGKTRRKP